MVHLDARLPGALALIALVPALCPWLMAGGLVGHEKIAEVAEPTADGRHEIVTLRTETSTPRARSLTTTFKRDRTPLGESQPARRQRKHYANLEAAGACQPCRPMVDGHGAAQSPK